MIEPGRAVLLDQLLGELLLLEQGDDEVELGLDGLGFGSRREAVGAGAGDGSGQGGEVCFVLHQIGGRGIGGSQVDLLGLNGVKPRVTAARGSMGFDYVSDPTLPYMRVANSGRRVLTP